MKKLTSSMIAMLAKQLPIQATTSKGGIPDIGPKRSLRKYDESTLIYNENTCGQTLQNIIDGSKIAVAIINRERLDGYRFVGSPEIFCEGEPYMDALEFAKKKGMAPPKFAILIHLENIYSLSSGNTAGKEL